MGDQNDCHVQPLFKLGHECEDLGLNGDIKGGGGSSAMSSFGYKPWPEQSSRVVACRLRTRTDIGSRGAQLQGCWLSATNQLQIPMLLKEKVLDGPEAFGDLLADGHGGVERGHGVLKDHANVSTSISSALSIGQLEKILTSNQAWPDRMLPGGLGIRSMSAWTVTDLPHQIRPQ